MCVRKLALSQCRKLFLVMTAKRETRDLQINTYVQGEKLSTYERWELNTRWRVTIEQGKVWIIVHGGAIRKVVVVVA